MRAEKLFPIMSVTAETIMIVPRTDRTAGSERATCVLIHTTSLLWLEDRVWLRKFHLMDLITPIHLRTFVILLGPLAFFCSTTSHFLKKLLLDILHFFARPPRIFCLTFARTSYSFLLGHLTYFF
jgi:hypothetical protein